MDDVTILFAPLNNFSYYMYQRNLDGSKFISMIAPCEWQYNFYKLKFLGVYQCNNGIWEKL